MKKFLQKKWEEKDIEFGIFCLLLLGMAWYYGWRLFALTPWYDELYTYYYFISKGPVYAAIHWPLPNNHVGYSVLSGFLNLFGNAAIGLRGVSWISSLLSLCLLFAIGKKCFAKGYALIAVFLFSAMGLVNQYAVQGRGYALATCLYLTAVYELVRICKEQDEKIWNYIILACSFVWALYTLPSSVYFVLPLCVSGGIVLLLQKKYKTFGKLFVTAVISAVLTVSLYAIIWLAIGSNLLTKNADSVWFGQGHVSIILHAPLQALQTGITYMLDTPYIQSVAREGYLSRFGSWIKTLFEYYYSGLSVALLAVVVIGMVMIIGSLLQRQKSKKQELQKENTSFLEWYLLISFLMTPLMLIIQAALPYYRVFSYFGIPVVLLIVWLLEKVRKCSWLFTFASGIFLIGTLAMPTSRAEYSEREAAIADAFSKISFKEGETICVTDCDQEYLMKYLYDKEDVHTPIEEADYVLLDKVLLLDGQTELASDVAGADAWKLYVTKEQISWDVLEKERQIGYENSRFVLYQK